MKTAVAICAEQGVASIAVAQVPPQFRETTEYIQCTVLAVDTLNGRSNWGVARAYTRDNPFATQVALTKAQRNAMRNLLPAQTRRTLIREFVEAGRVEAVKLAAPMEKKATRRQLARISKEVEATGAATEQMLTYYGVTSLEELSREQASNAIQLLDKKRHELPSPDRDGA